MSTKPISGIYLRASGNEPKLVIRRKIGPFQDQYDVHRPWDKIDIIRDLIPLLNREFDDFLVKFLSVDEMHHKKSPHRSGHYISQNINLLYPAKDKKFAKEHSFLFKGYWIGTNVGPKEIFQYVREMCEACDITFGSCAELKF